MESILEEIEKDSKQNYNEERMIKTFEIEDLKFDVRIVKRGKIVLFCLKDVCDILGIENPSNVKKRLNPHYLHTVEVKVNTGFGTTLKAMTFIEEPNIYRCIMESRKESALKFKDWVCDDILPSIRKTGMYLTQEVYQQLWNDPTRLGQMLIDYGKAQEEIKRQNKQIEEMQPKVDFADTFLLNFKQDISMGEFAKLTEKEFGIGRNKMFELLRNLCILMKNNLPYQQYMKYFTITEGTKNGKDYLTTLIKVEGQVYLLKRLKKELGNK